MKFPGSSRGALSLALWLLTALAPIAMSLLYLYIFHHATLFDHIPSISDSIDYWTEITAFMRAGFNSGYFGYEELHAPIGGYGAHSVWYPMFFAGIGALAGWNAYSLVLWQTVILAGAVFAFCALTRPSIGQLLFLAAFTVSYPPFLYWPLQSLQESLHLAIGILLAGLTFQLVVRDGQERLTAGFRLLYLLAVFLATLCRFTWVFFYVFYLMVVTRPAARSVLVAAAKFIVAFIVMYLVAFHLFRVVYPYGESRGFILGQALRGDFSYLFNLISENLRLLFLDWKPDPDGYMLIMRYQALLYIPAVAVGCWMARERIARENGAPQSVAFFFPAVHLLAMTSVIAMLIFLYTAEDIYFMKLVTPVFVFSLFFAARTLKSKWLWLVVAVNVLSWPSAIGCLFYSTDIVYDARGASQQRIGEFRELTSPLMRFDPDAPPWCNTLAVTEYTIALLGIDPGIGINHIEDLTKFSGPMKSRYLLAPAKIDRGVLPHLGDLRYLVATPFGDLYLNHSADCPQKPRQQAGDRGKP